MRQVATTKELKSFARRMDRMRFQRLKQAQDGLLPVEELAADEKRILHSSLTDLKADRGREDFFFFCKYVLGYGDLSKMHVELCDFLTKRTKAGKFYRHQLILEPRDTFKTSVVTIGFPLWMITRDPNIRILISSEEYSKSKTFLREIKQHIVHNDIYRKCYGELDSSKYTDLWQEANFNVSTRTIRGKEPSFSAAGIDVTKVGFHYDIIICDDLVSEKNITTPEQIQKTINYFKLLFSLFDKGSKYRMMIVVGTRWHFQDLYQYIMDEDQERVRQKEKKQYRKLIRPARFKDGSLLFPERLDENFLKGMQIKQGSYIFSCQYLNDPAGAEFAAFKEEWIEWFTELPAGMPFTFGIIVDPSVGQHRGSDFTAIVSVAVDPLNNWYVLTVDRGHWNPTEIISQLTMARRRIIRDYAEKWPAAKNVRVGMEVVAFQKVLAHFTRDLMRRKEIERFRVIELKTETTVRKEMRIRGLVPNFENRKVSFKGRGPKQCSPGMKMIVRELIQFPVGKTDDCIDALAYMPQIVQVPDNLRAELPKETMISRIRQRMKERGELLHLTEPRVGSRIGRSDPWLIG